MNEKLEKKLEELPRKPGVYIFLGDKRQRPVYIGKAKDLRQRVRSYFQASDDDRHLYPFIVSETTDVEIFVCANEKEALILENNLIKQQKPRYNVRLTDDKTYLSLKVTTQEAWPRVLLVRRVKRDGARYFGPYSSASSVRKAVNTIRKYFPLRTCTNAEFDQRTRPCIQYEIGRCCAPCVDLVTEEEYEAIVEDVQLFLEGKDRRLLDRLQAKMERQAEELNYEAAARTRDQIQAIEKTLERQRITSQTFIDQDVFGWVVDGKVICVQALFIREGKLLSANSYSFTTELDPSEALDAFLRQFYTEGKFIPKEILFPKMTEDRETLEEILSERKGRRVRIHFPRRGKKRELVDLAAENAAQVLRHSEKKKQETDRLLSELEERLELKQRPDTIECFDISTIQGVLNVGSKVCFHRLEPDKSRYRKYKIRTVDGQDDFAAVSEVVGRRLDRGIREETLPDLLLIDGGRGQLAAACRAAEERGLCDLDIVSIAKARRRKKGRVPERIFLPGRSEPVIFNENDPCLHLLQRLRDEAHRFAIGYHRQLRRKKSFRTILGEIPGVGPKRKKALLTHFGSLSRVREASREELAEVPGIGDAQAEVIRTFFEDLANEAV